VSRVLLRLRLVWDQLLLPSLLLLLVPRKWLLLLGLLLLLDT
jgi:hypothetical protein